MRVDFSSKYRVKELNLDFIGVDLFIFVPYKSTDFPKILNLPKGTELTFLDGPYVGRGNIKWYHVHGDNGITGYLSENHLGDIAEVVEGHMTQYFL